jgi:glutaredoxin
MDTREEKIIRKWSDSVEVDIEIGLVLTEDKRSEALEDFAEQLSLSAPRVKVRREVNAGAEMPAILIRSNISYHGIPSENELETFLDALHPGGNESGTGIGMPDTAGAGHIPLPAQLDLYIMMHCSFCPMAVKKLVALAAAGPRVRLRIIDGFLFEERAKRDGVRSVPTLLLDGTCRWAGDIDLKEVIAMAIRRDPSTLSAGSMENMLKEGEAARLAEMMVERGQIFPAFFELLVHEKWPVRLGAMVAAETIVERNTDLSRQIAAPLWERLEHAGDAAKGDILYILGEAGDESMIPGFESFLSSNPGKELKEAAEEAVSRIRSRIRS